MGASGIVGQTAEDRDIYVPCIGSSRDQSTSPLDW